MTLVLRAWRPAVNDLGGDRPRKLGQEGEKKGMV